MPNETVQTPQVPSGNVAAAQATLSVPAATAQVSSAAPAAEQETLEVHISFLVNFFIFYAFLLFSSRLLFSTASVCSAGFLLHLFSCFLAVSCKFYICLVHASSLFAHGSFLFVICLNLFACCSGPWDFGDFL